MNSRRLPRQQVLASCLLMIVDVSKMAQGAETGMVVKPGAREIGIDVDEGDYQLASEGANMGTGTFLKRVLRAAGVWEKGACPRF